MSAAGRLALLAAVLLLTAGGAVAQPDDRLPGITPSRPADYRSVIRTSRHLTMPDGVRLAVDLYLPGPLLPDVRLPAIVMQTRYVRSFDFRWPFSLFLHNQFDRTIAYTVRRGYAWLVADARGSGASFGSRQVPYGPAERDDLRAMTDWVVSQAWSDGRVAGWGSSYTGGSALFLAASGHPAVRAVMPRFAMFDLYAEGVFPGGIHLRWLTDTWGALAAALDRNAPWEYAGRNAKIAARGIRPVDGDPTRRLLAEAVSDHAANRNVRELVDGIVFRDDPSPALPSFSFDDISPHRAVPAINRSKASVSIVTGWYDAAFVRSSIHLFQNIDRGRASLLIGPWDHGLFQTIGPGPGGGTVRFDSDAHTVHFLDRHLAGRLPVDPDEPRVRYFTLVENRWKSADEWPPPGARDRRLYLAQDGVLSAENRTGADGCDRYRVDPDTGSGASSRWESLVNLKHRPIGYPDRANRERRLTVYRTEPLGEQLEATGHPLVTLFVRADSPDGAFFAYLGDEAEDGTVAYVSEGMVRAIHRTIGPEPPPYRTPVPYRTFQRRDARPLIPGETAELTFDLLPISYLFRPGHRIRLALANADTDHFAPVTPAPTAVEYCRGPSAPSALVLPVVGCESGDTNPSRLP